MQAGRFKRLAASAIMAVTLAVVGLSVASPAARADQEPPINVYAVANSPGMITVYWDILGNDHYWFWVEEQSTGSGKEADRDKRGMSLGNWQPNTTYRFRVCAVYAFNRVCSNENGGAYASVTTPPAQPPPPPPPPPSGGSGGSSGGSRGSSSSSVPTLSPPTDVRVTALTATSATVTWQPGSWPQGGNLQPHLGIGCTDQATGDSCYGTTTEGPLPPTTSSFRLTRLQTGHRYGIVVCKEITWWPPDSLPTYPSACSPMVFFEMQPPPSFERSGCVETGTCVTPPAAEPRREGCQLTGTCGAPAPAEPRRGRGCQLMGTCGN